VLDTRLLLCWAMVIVYGAAQAEHKQEFLTELAVVCSSQRIPVIIGEGVNLLISSQEKNKSFHRG
jgi:hypothetical protein